MPHTDTPAGRTGIAEGGTFPVPPIPTQAATYITAARTHRTGTRAWPLSILEGGVRFRQHRAHAQQRRLSGHCKRPPSAYALTHSYAARYPSPHNATAAAHGFNKLTPARNSIAGAQRAGSVSRVYPVDQARWEQSWYRQWYHQHPIVWNNGQYWWDPNVSKYVAYVEGETLPEEQYVAAVTSGTEQIVSAEDPVELVGGDNAPLSSGTEQDTPGSAIRIVNPAHADATLSYAVNEYSYEIQPGESQDLNQDRTWVIEFHRGGDFGTARYTLEAGRYVFANTDHGWELYHHAIDEAGAGA